MVICKKLLGYIIRMFQLSGSSLNNVSMLLARCIVLVHHMCHTCRFDNWVIRLTPLNINFVNLS